jgi:RNA polymerase primary sigma factor
MLRVTTKTSKREALKSWASPPPFVMNDELRPPHIERELFKDWPRPAADAGSPGLAEQTLLFKQLNYCAYRLRQLYEAADHHGPKSSMERSYREWRRRYQLLRTRIIEGNLGLVYDSIRRSRFNRLDRDQMCSEAMMALLRAADTFDPWRGYHFSTYACNAISRALSRSALQESKRRNRIAELFEAKSAGTDPHTTQHSTQRALFAERLQQVLQMDNASLSAVEKTVLARRFPMEEGCRPQTLEDIGRQMRLSKERVRQIQISAIAKLRRTLARDNVLQ